MEKPPEDVNDEAVTAIANQRNSQIEKIYQEYNSLANHVPSEWGITIEEKLSLVKAIHVDILGVDKNGQIRSLQDLRYFLFNAAQRGLNPFKNQVHAKYHWSKDVGKEVLIIVVGIDGLRSIAQKTGKYAGSSKATYVYKEDGSIESASIKIYGYNPKTGAREEVAEGEAYFDEYVQLKRDGTPNRFWATMPRVMISKCAEAGALRKAFPEQLDGLYAPEEIQQATVAVEAEPVAKKPAKKLQNFSKPPEEKKEYGAESSPTILDAVHPGTENVSASMVSSEDEEEPEKTLNRDELIQEIKDLFHFLKFTDTNQLRIIKEHSGTPFINKASVEGLRKAHEELEELATAKTNLLAEEADSKIDKEVE